ncbi:hypothetical protein KW785_02270 [Candidatus Parcubacteria bacterium]|nr:hypothetical protein [Candidatus Parcubacteria bacterium]
MTRVCGIEMYSGYDLLSVEPTRALYHFGNLERQLGRQDLEREDKDLLTLQRTYCEGVLIARLKGLEPPISLRDQLCCKRAAMPVGCPYSVTQKNPGECFAVRDMTYDNHHGWLVMFIGHGDFEMYRLVDFEKIDKLTDTSVTK